MDNGNASAILILHTGRYENAALGHEDYVPNLEALRGYTGIATLELNILEGDLHHLNVRLDRLFSKHNIAVIDTHQIRFWQKRWSEFQPRLALVQKFAGLARARMINSMAMFEWNLDKGRYLLGLEKNGLPIVPTSVAGSQDQAETIGLSSLVEGAPDGIAVKPSSGARALGLSFITRQNEMFSVRQPVTPDDATAGDRAAVDVRDMSAAELDAWFAAYRAACGVPVLVQNLIQPRHEVSVIWLEGHEPYAILRTTGEETGVAHEAFGGQNIPLAGMSPHLLDILMDFARRTKAAVPPVIAQEALHRFDILVTPAASWPGTQRPERMAGLLLLEVESVSPRCFNETRQSNTFAAMLAAAARRQHGIKLGTPQEPLADTQPQRRCSYSPADVEQLYCELDLIATSHRRVE